MWYKIWETLIPMQRDDNNKNAYGKANLKHMVDKYNLAQVFYLSG